LKSARPFLPDSTLTFTEQILNWDKQDELIEMQRRERAQKRALLKQRGGGLLARELKGLGVPFYSVGNAILPMG
jgi:hypothetical protein